VQQSPEAGSLLLRWRLEFLMDVLTLDWGIFLLAMHFKIFLRWTGLVCTFIGAGDNLESILLISPVANLYLSFRMQECRPPSPQDAGMLLLSIRDGILTHVP
jgi:hypothetical protein